MQAVQLQHHAQPQFPLPRAAQPAQSPIASPNSAPLAASAAGAAEIRLSCGWQELGLRLCAEGAAAWAADNIQANAVLPGWIDTELTRGARDQIPGLHERVLQRTPVGRWGEIDDMAGIAVFLASPASDFLTGTAIPVDGGYSVMG